jgi:hypothetical protein
MNLLFYYYNHLLEPQFNLEKLKLYYYYYYYYYFFMP